MKFNQKYVLFGLIAVFMICWGLVYTNCGTATDFQSTNPSNEKAVSSSTNTLVDPSSTPNNWAAIRQLPTHELRKKINELVQSSSQVIEKTEGSTLYQLLDPKTGEKINTALIPNPNYNFIEYPGVGKINAYVRVVTPGKDPGTFKETGGNYHYECMSHGCQGCCQILGEATCDCDSTNAGTGDCSWTKVYDGESTVGPSGQ
jgi:hypothetical protein